MGESDNRWGAGTARGLKREKVVKIARLSGYKNFVGKREREREVYIQCVRWEPSRSRITRSQRRLSMTVGCWADRIILRARKKCVKLGVVCILLLSDEVWLSDGGHRRCVNWENRGPNSEDRSLRYWYTNCTGSERWGMWTNTNRVATASKVWLDPRRNSARDTKTLAKSV